MGDEGFDAVHQWEPAVSDGHQRLFEDLGLWPPEKVKLTWKGSAKQYLARV